MVEEVEQPKIGLGVSQEQIHGLLFGDKLSWQAIIYDLINTEQLNPWDVDICLLANKYLEKVKLLEEANFFVSSKVLLAASLLLRIKSEILLNQYIPSLDEILFGKQENKKYEQERLVLDEEIPELVPRTPLPRGRKVTLQELISALGKAIKTETRRIRKVVIDRQRQMETGVVLPRKAADLQHQIKFLYEKLKGILSKEEIEKAAFSTFSGKTPEEKVAHFVPLLHLDYQHKVLAEQEKCFDEIWVWLKEKHDKKHSTSLEIARKEVEDFLNNEAERLKEEDKKEDEERKNRKDKKFKKDKAVQEEVFETIDDDFEGQEEIEVKEEKVDKEIDEE